MVIRSFEDTFPLELISPKTMMSWFHYWVFQPGKELEKMVRLRLIVGIIDLRLEYTSRIR